jgi:hypothetical protein
MKCSYAYVVYEFRNFDRHPEDVRKMKRGGASI